MKTILAGILAGMMITGGGLALGEQEPGRGKAGPGGEGEQPPAADGGMHEGMLGRIVGNPKVAEKLGLTADQVKTLREKSYELEREMIRLRAEKELAALEQAKALSENEVSERDVMKAVEKTGRLQIEIAKIRARQLILIKGVLTPDQVEKARELFRAQMERRGDEMRRWARRGEGGEAGGEPRRADRKGDGEGRKKGGESKPAAATEGGQEGN